MDAVVANNAEKGWEINLGAGLGNYKINIPSTGYPEVLNKRE
jgi:hypothetical protein